MCPIKSEGVKDEHILKSSKSFSLRGLQKTSLAGTFGRLQHMLRVVSKQEVYMTRLRLI